MVDKEVTTPIRVGVIGLGYSGEVHLHGYKQLPNVEIVALAGLEDDKLQALGKKFEVPHLYRHYEDLLAHEGLDAVSIGVPNFLHAPIAQAALERGLHVLCEKPLARTAAEGEAMVQAAEKAGRVLQVVFNHRERGDVHLLKGYIDEGKLGEIYYAKAYWLRRHGIPGAGSWFGNKAMSGGGPLIDLGVHMMDMALYLLGEPQVLTVSGSTFSKLGHRGVGVSRDWKFGSGHTYDVEDLGSAFMRLSNGATLLLEASWATHKSDGDEYGVVLYGTEGGAEIRVINYAWENTLSIYTDVDGKPVDLHPEVTLGEYHNAVVRQFIETITSGDWAGKYGYEGLRRTKVIEACYTSAALGREVVLKENIGD